MQPDSLKLTKFDHLVIRVGVALGDGLDYFGHELDDVTGEVHALTPEAMKYERAFDAFCEICDELGRLVGKLEEDCSPEVEAVLRDSMFGDPLD